MRTSVGTSLRLAWFISFGLLCFNPFTKVEESFTLHAIRDFLTLSPAQLDKVRIPRRAVYVEHFSELS